LERVFELEAKSEVLRGLRRELRLLLGDAGWNQKATEEIVLALDEALTNVIRHAYSGKSGPMKVVFRDFPDRTELTVEDRGARFDPTRIPEPKLPREKPGGLGVYFIKKIMDEMIYDDSFIQGNRLYMIKRKTTS